MKPVEGEKKSVLHNDVRDMRDVSMDRYLFINIIKKVIILNRTDRIRSTPDIHSLILSIIADKQSFAHLHLNHCRKASVMINQFKMS